MLGIVEQQNAVIRNFIGQPATPTVSAPTPTPSAPAWSADDPYVTPAQLQQYAPRIIQDTVNPMFQNVVEQQAQTSRAIVEREAQSMFQKYGPEINALLATVPKTMWTVDNVRKVVNLVKADHVDEIARERAGQLIAEMPETLRSNGAALPAVSSPTGPTLNSERIPQEFRDRLAAAKVTEDVAKEFCRANNMAFGDFVAMIEKTAITENPRG